MRRDDPKRLKLQAERERTALRLDILCQGIAKALQSGFPLGPVIHIINTELVAAMQDAQAAEDAYRPYWSRRRLRRSTLRPRVKKTVSKAVN
jgi:hypothetical protein